MRSAIAILFIIFAASAYTEITFTIPGNESRANETKQTQPPQQAGQNDKRGTQDSPVVVKVLPSPKTSDEAKAEAKEHEEKSAGDRKMLWFNGTIAAAAIIQFIVGIFQYRVYTKQAKIMAEALRGAEQQSLLLNQHIAEAARQARAMEGQIEETRRLADSAAISATAGAKAADVVEKRTAQQMRAYLSVVVGQAIPQNRSTNTRFEGKPLLINNGHTPAYKVSYKIRAQILIFPLNAPFDFPLPEQATDGGVIGPHQNVTMSAIVDDYVADIAVPEIKNCTSNALFVWGVVNYEDAFKESRETRFCQSFQWISETQVIGYFTPQRNSAT